MIRFLTKWRQDEMAKHISAMEIRKRFGEIMNAVSLRGDEYIVERDGKPMVAVVPIWKLRQLEEKKEAFWKNVEKFREEGGKVEKEELESAITEAVNAAKSDQ